MRKNARCSVLNLMVLLFLIFQGIETLSDPSLNFEAESESKLSETNKSEEAKNENSESQSEKGEELTVR